MRVICIGDPTLPSPDNLETEPKVGLSDIGSVLPEVREFIDDGYTVKAITLREPIFRGSLITSEWH